ncbi:unnamed protein product [Discosporangium mesarthrocarpum]
MAGEVVWEGHLGRRKRPNVELPRLEVAMKRPDTGFFGSIAHINSSCDPLGGSSLPPPQPSPSGLSPCRRADLQDTLDVVDVRSHLKLDAGEEDHTGTRLARIHEYMDTAELDGDGGLSPESWCHTGRDRVAANRTMPPLMPSGEDNQGLHRDDKTYFYSETFGEGRIPSYGRPSLPPPSSVGFGNLGHRRSQSAPDVGRTTGAYSAASATYHHQSAGGQWPAQQSTYGPENDVQQPGLAGLTGGNGHRYQAHEPPVDDPEGFVVGRRHATPAMLKHISTSSSLPGKDHNLPWGFGLQAPQPTPDSHDWTPKLNNFSVDMRQGQDPSLGLGIDTSSSGSLTLGKMPMVMGDPTTEEEDVRPFEEIKRLRLSQVAEERPDETTLAPQPHNNSVTNISSLVCKSSTWGAGAVAVAGAGARFGAGVTWQTPTSAVHAPPSPAVTVTAPPTPVPLEVFDNAQVPGPGCRDTRMIKAWENPNTLPVERRPAEEVSAAMALVSVGVRAVTPRVDGITQHNGETLYGANQAAVPERRGGTEGLADQGDIKALPVVQGTVPLEGKKERMETKGNKEDDDDDGLDKSLWAVVEKNNPCDRKDCIYRDNSTRIATRRHYHANCNHTHNEGLKKGMAFHHHQLEKVQKHQRSHKRQATKSAPYKRTTPEDHEAMEGAGVEGYHPEDWDPEETTRLEKLVNQQVPPVTHAWPSIARFFPTKSSVQCLLHWRFTLNRNGVIRGNGTWGAEEDARLRKLAPVFSSPSTGPRWAKIAEVMPGRTAKQCRERYNNHVDPAIKKDKNWTKEEDTLILKLHAIHQNQFAKIAKHIEGRCYDDVKNRYNLLVKRKLTAASLMGSKQNEDKPSDKATHRGNADSEDSSTGSDSDRQAVLLGNRRQGAEKSPSFRIEQRQARR